MGKESSAHSSFSPGSNLLQIVDFCNETGSPISTDCEKGKLIEKLFCFALTDMCLRDDSKHSQYHHPDQEGDVENPNKCDTKM